MKNSIVFLFVSLFLLHLTIQTRDSFKYFDYDVDAFHRLTSHKISSTVVNSMEDCAMTCLVHWECFSFNLGNPTAAGKHECELIRTDKYNSYSTYSYSNDFHHFFIRSPCGSGETLCRNGGTCYPVYEDSSYKCVCLKGYNGRHCENKQEAKTCLGWLQNGYKESGIYIISGNKAYCDMTTDGGGWRVFLRRKDGTVDFDRSQQGYKYNFGSLEGEFWYGLQPLRNLFFSRRYELRVDLEDWDGNTAYANYAEFKINGRSTHYSLKVGGYSGTAGDSLSSANGMGFSTKYSDNDGNDTANCAEVSKAGWWFSNCFQALLTGPYSHTPHGGNGIIWKDWKGFNYSLKSCEMKMRALGNLK